MLLLLPTGCATHQLADNKRSAVAIGLGKSLTFTFARDFRLDPEEIVECVSQALQRSDPTLRIVSAGEFLRTAFPDLEPEAAPRSPSYLALLLDNDTFRRRIAPLEIRYIVSLSGATEQREEGVVGLPHIAAGVTWERKTQLTAWVFDLKVRSKRGEAVASAKGQPAFGMMRVPPFLWGIPARTESEACREFGDRVARLIQHDEISENP